MPGREVSQKEREKRARYCAKSKEKLQKMSPEERTAFYRKQTASRKPLVGEAVEKRKAKRRAAAKIRREKQKQLPLEERKVYTKKPRKPLEGEKLEKRKARKKVTNKLWQDKKRAEFLALPESKKRARRQERNAKRDLKKHAEHSRRYLRNLPEEKKTVMYNARELRNKEPTKCWQCGVTIRHDSMRKHERMHRRLTALLQPLSAEQRAAIEKLSREGADTPGGQKVRQYRITGTRIHDVVSYALNGKDLSKLAQNYAHASGQSLDKIPAIQAGKIMEPYAIAAFQEVMGIPNDQFQKKVGFLVHPDYAYLGATPDATYTTKDGKNACVEVKYVVKGVENAACLVRAKTPTGKDSRAWKQGKGGKYLTSKPGGSRQQMQLNRGHRYFSQVVMQIMCGEKQFCDFVVYAINQNKGLDLWRERVFRKEAEVYWRKWLPLCVDFFKSYADLLAKARQVLSESAE